MQDLHIDIKKNFFEFLFTSEKVRLFHLQIIAVNDSTSLGIIGLIPFIRISYFSIFCEQSVLPQNFIMSQIGDHFPVCI